MLRQAVKTCHSLSGTFEAERLCQREIGIEHCHRILLSVYALQSAPEELLAHFRLVTAIVEKAQSHVRDVKILFLMMLFNMVSDVINFGEGTMKALMVNLIYHAIQPSAIVFIPLLATLYIVHKRLVRLVEIRVAATHLCLIDVLQHYHLLIRGLLLFLLIRRLLLGGKGYVYHQQSNG